MITNALHSAETATNHNQKETIMPVNNYRIYDLTVLRDGRKVRKDAEFTAELNLDDTRTIDPHLRAAVVRDNRDPATSIGEYVLEIREHGKSGRPLMSYVTTRGIG